MNHEEKKAKLNRLKNKVYVKLYEDLFILYENLFYVKDLTFSNFINSFGKQIDSLFEFNNPKCTYNSLLTKVSDLVHQHLYHVDYTDTSNPIEKKKRELENNKANIWSIITQYLDYKGKKEQNNEIIQEKAKIKKQIESLNQEIKLKRRSEDVPVKKDVKIFLKSQINLRFEEIKASEKLINKLNTDKQEKVCKDEENLSKQIKEIGALIQKAPIEKKEILNKMNQIEKKQNIIINNLRTYNKKKEFSEPKNEVTLIKDKKFKKKL